MIAAANLVDALQHAGDHREAGEIALYTLRLAISLDRQRIASYALLALASAATRAGDTIAAAQLFGRARAAYAALGAEPYRNERVLADELDTALRGSLEPAKLKQLIAEGAVMSLDVAEARAAAALASTSSA